VVSLVSDGSFTPADGAMIANLEHAHIQRFLELGLVECDDVDNYRIHTDYWAWQSSVADLQKMEQQREASHQRQAQHRAKEQG
jgi:hypothetical protein